EEVGYEASDADLFVDRPWVVVPGSLAGESDIERVTELAVACRANVVRMDAAVHDRAVAAISHLPLIVSAALVEAVAIRPATPSLARRHAPNGRSPQVWLLAVGET